LWDWTALTNFSTDRYFKRSKSCVKMMILKQSKKRKTFFRRRKFDILIRFV
jgi:hypothetical protein